jgi:hypothetical protein
LLMFRPDCIPDMTIPDFRVADLPAAASCGRRRETLTGYAVP